MGPGHLILAVLIHHTSHSKPQRVLGSSNSAIQSSPRRETSVPVCVITCQNDLDRTMCQTCHYLVLSFRQNNVSDMSLLYSAAIYTEQCVRHAITVLCCYLHRTMCQTCHCRIVLLFTQSNVTDMSLPYCADIKL